MIAAIALPESIIDITDNSLAFTLYEQSVFFPVKGSPPNIMVGSSVISASIGGVTDGTELPDPVVISLALEISVCYNFFLLILISLQNATNLHCVYWNFTAAGTVTINIYNL